MNTLRCPKCGSERLEKKPPPASIREHLESVISPTSGLMLSAERRRFGVECMECGYLGVVRVHGIMSRVFIHLAVAAVLVGLLILALAAW